MECKPEIVTVKECHLQVYHWKVEWKGEKCGRKLHTQQEQMKTPEIIVKQKPRVILILVLCNIFILQVTVFCLF